VVGAASSWDRALACIGRVSLAASSPYAQSWRCWGSVTRSSAGRVDSARALPADDSDDRRPRCRGPAAVLFGQPIRRTG
jgi:hypothetical protein